MPERAMNGLQVFANRAGGISLEQDGDVVAIHVSQVDQVIQWLRDLKVEIASGVYEADPPELGAVRDLGDDEPS